MQIVKASAESLETNLVESSAAAQKRDFLPNRNFNDSRFLFLQISFLLPLSQRAIFKNINFFSVLRWPTPREMFGIFLLISIFFSFAAIASS